MRVQDQEETKQGVSYMTSFWRETLHCFYLMIVGSHLELRAAITLLMTLSFFTN